VWLAFALWSSYVNTIRNINKIKHDATSVGSRGNRNHSRQQNTLDPFILRAVKTMVIYRHRSIRKHSCEISRTWFRRNLLTNISTLSCILLNFFLVYSLFIKFLISLTFLILNDCSSSLHSATSYVGGNIWSRGKGQLHLASTVFCCSCHCNFCKKNINALL